jgi:hypothetical protein
MSGKVKTEQGFPGQRPGEEVQMVFHQHPLVMRKQLIIGLIVMVLAILPLDFPQVYVSVTLTSWCIKIAAVAYLAVLAYWVHRWIGWYYTVYIVTDQRVVEIKQKGLFDRTVSEWQLDNILFVNYRVGGFQAVIFSYGDITLRTYVGDLVIKTVHKPTHIHAQLQAIVLAHGGGKGEASNSTPFGN